VSVKFYGYNVDPEHFDGRFGPVVRALNRAREVVERATEIAAVVHDADKNGEPMGPVLLRLREEGLLRPAPARSRAPLHVLDQFRKPEPDDPNVEGRFYSTRDYSARVGRRLDVERAERDAGITRDPNFNLRPRLRTVHDRATRYVADPIVRECFEPMNPEER